MTIDPEEFGGLDRAFYREKIALTIKQMPARWLISNDFSGQNQGQYSLR